MTHAFEMVRYPIRYRKDDHIPQQRIWRRCVFVDWHGVLCDLPFWHSITQNPRHQLRARIENEVDGLFTHHTLLVDSWMRGRIDSARVVSELEDPPDRRCGPNYLYRRLIADCEEMTPRAELLEALKSLPPLTLIVLATDNMDCFSDAIPKLQPLHGTFHAALCSSDIGVLKAEDPSIFFGEWLLEHGVAPEDAVLIDDAERNCSSFEQLGGKAIRFATCEQATTELRTWAQEP